MVLGDVVISRPEKIVAGADRPLRSLAERRQRTGVVRGFIDYMALRVARLSPHASISLTYTSITNMSMISKVRPLLLVWKWLELGFNIIQVQSCNL